jgi:hypothetical protein
MIIENPLRSSFHAMIDSCSLWTKEDPHETPVPHSRASLRMISMYRRTNDPFPRVGLKTVLSKEEQSSLSFGPYLGSFTALWGMVRTVASKLASPYVLNMGVWLKPHGLSFNDEKGLVKFGGVCKLQKPVIVTSSKRKTTLSTGS